jgi:dihydrofolate synthase / folylpolyglutamate synthase
MSLDKSYQETIEYLYALQKHGVKLALANSMALMEALGAPHQRFPSVHVAGTNGKGSTSAFIAAMLQAAGCRVGLYTSPHLISFTERIRIDNVRIPERSVVDLARRVRRAYADRKGLSPTFFEVTTAMAFTYFAEEGIDLAVVEAGMGGRLDSTNVLAPLVSVITNIDIEHTEFLGDTLVKIAEEKAGIVKPGVPVVTGAAQPEAVEVIERRASALHANVRRLYRDFQPENATTMPEQVFDYRGIDVSYERLRINLLGRHQVDNACLALAAVECLRTAGISVDEPAARRGLAGASWEGRLERVARRPDIFLDGAHNPASAKKLADAIREMMPFYSRLILIIGVLCDKDYRRILEELVPLAAHVVATKPQYARALDARTLAAEIRSRGASVETAGTLDDAVGRARAAAAPEDLVLVTGSLYTVGDARTLFFSDDGRTGPLAGLKG